MLKTRVVRHELISREWTDERKEMGADVIHEHLCMFRDEAVLVRHARYEGNRLKVTFKKFEHPFSPVGTQHFSREQAIVVITQAACLLGSLLWPRSEYPSKTGETNFNHLVATEKALFTAVHLRFRKTIENQDGLTATISLQDIRQVGSSLLFKMPFVFQNGECFGFCMGAINLGR